MHHWSGPCAEGRAAGVTQGSGGQLWPAGQPALLKHFLCMPEHFAHWRRWALQDPAGHPDEFSLLEGAVTKLGRICAHVGSGLRPEGSPVLQRYLQVGWLLAHAHAPRRVCSMRGSHAPAPPAPGRRYRTPQQPAAVPGTSCNVCERLIGGSGHPNSCNAIVFSRVSTLHLPSLCAPALTVCKAGSSRADSGGPAARLETG